MPQQSRQKAVLQAILKLLDENPHGLVRADLLRRITEKGYREGTAQWALWQLSKRKKVYKPERALYLHAKYQADQEDDQDVGDTPQAKSVKEEEFYQSFAEWLVEDVEDLTRAIPLGGNKFRDRWGTPDVIGKKESLKSDIIKGTEIVSAEVKSDANQLITAFGQACAYKLFSHKCYLVVPKKSPPAHIERLDSLCQLFGIGLVLFDAENTDAPDYQIRTRPQKHEPDLFYTNKYMKIIESDLWGK